MKKPSFTAAAVENIMETGLVQAAIDDDVDMMRRGKTTPASLLADCLNGSDPDREQGWIEYVNTVALLAKE